MTLFSKYSKLFFIVGCFLLCFSFLADTAYADCDYFTADTHFVWCSDGSNFLMAGAWEDCDCSSGPPSQSYDKGETCVNCANGERICVYHCYDWSIKPDSSCAGGYCDCMNISEIAEDDDCPPGGGGGGEDYSYWVELTAVPSFGYAPLDVDFNIDYLCMEGSCPGMVEAQLDFGDGTTGECHDSSCDLVDFMAGSYDLHTYGLPAAYTAHLIMTDANGASWDDTAVVTVSDGVSCEMTASPTSGQSPLDVQFDITADGYQLNEWQLEYGDGTQECSPGPCSGNPDGLIRNFTYNGGIYDAKLTCSNPLGRTDSDTEIIRAAVSNLRHTSNTGASINWQWDEAYGATSYLIYTRPYVGCLESTSVKSFPESPVFGASFIQTKFRSGVWFNFDEFWWNVESNIGVQVCRGWTCAPSAWARAATSIETPNIISCNDPEISLPNRLHINVFSNERPVCPSCADFSHTWFTDWIVNQSRVDVKVEKDGVVYASKSFPISIGCGGVTTVDVPFWSTDPVLEPNTTYNVCAKSQNQQAVEDGDFRPSGADSCAPANRVSDGVNDWCCTTCATNDSGSSASPCISNVRVKTQSDGIVELCVVAEGEAETGNGVVKVALPGGAVGEADLVDLTHPDASPVRIRLLGVTKAWREKTE